MNRLNLIFVLIIAQFTLSGCGDMFGKKVIKAKLESTATNANCELDMDRFSEILESDITESIKCLEKNLNIFMNISELGRGQKLSRVALINYLRFNEPSTTEKTIAVVNTVFSMAALITGEEADFISRANVGKIVELVKVFNIQAARHYKHTFGSDKPATLSVHESHRRLIENASVEIRSALEKIYVSDRGGVVNQVEIMDILKGFIADKPDSIEKIEGVLFVKKIIVGGDIKTINHKELGFIFQHLPKLLSLVLDGVRYKNLKLEQPQLLDLLHKDTIELAGILFHPERGSRSYEGLFEVDMAIDGVDRFIKEPEDKISKYRVLIKEALHIFTKIRNEAATENATDEYWITGRELEKLFSHIYNVTKRGLAFHKIYNSPNIKPLLNAPQSVQLDPKNYEAEFPDNKVDLVEFSRIVNKYRYMKGSQPMASYSLEYKRNPNGVAEIAIYEYLINNFFGYYGTSYAMSNVQLRTILKKFENELIEMDIILPRRSRSTAETISLLGSLFQAQSDDNKVLDVNEATEFAISLVTAIDAKKELYKFLDARGCAKDDYGRFDPACFRAHFYQGICTNYRDQFPRLFKYLGADPGADCEQNFNSEANTAYLDASIVAARTCHVFSNGEEIKYSESDIMSILLAMMHIETTITRWDINLNNTMDANEVLNAYGIYKPAIEGMLPDAIKKFPPKIRETLTKLVFQYLVKFEDTPKLEGKDIVKTIFNLGKLLVKKAPASRKTIASILRVVSEQSKIKSQAEYDANPNDPMNEKPFNCDWLEHPNNIPRD